jgi:hypothetical protein
VSDPPHTGRDALEISTRRRDRLRARAMRAARRAGALATDVSAQVGPQLDAIADWVTRPENAERLQRGLATVAQVGISAGFKADPAARLLFEFADLVAHDAGREPVVRAITAHSPMLDGSLLDLVQSRVAALRGDEAAYLRRLDEVRLRVLRMLCALAELFAEDDLGPPPELPHVDAYLEYFDDAVVPPRYADLATLAAGSARAWERLDELYPTARSRRREVRAQTTALARRDARSTEREFAFLTTSYMLFAQAFLTRGLIEELPGLFAAARAADEAVKEAEAAAEPPDPDVIDM